MQYFLKAHGKSLNLFSNRTKIVGHCTWRPWGHKFSIKLFFLQYLTFWRRDYFFFNFSTPVYKMWIIQSNRTKIVGHCTWRPGTHILHKIIFLQYLTFWRRIFFFLILAHPVYNMWIIQEPNTLELWNKLHFEEKNGEYIPCLTYSVPIFVE